MSHKFKWVKTKDNFGGKMLAHLCTTCTYKCSLFWTKLTVKVLFDISFITFEMLENQNIYRIIPNKRAGRGDEVGGAFIMCTKMLICISRPHLAAAPLLSQATLVRTRCTCKPPSTLKPPLVRAVSRCNWYVNTGRHLMQPRPAI